MTESGILGNFRVTMLIYEISGLFDTVKEVFGLVVLWKLPL